MTKLANGQVWGPWLVLTKLMSYVTSLKAHIVTHLCVANSWNPGAAFTAFPCVGTERVRDSSSGINTDTTSMGARSISSRRIQYPACTACKRGPGCQTNSPGLSVDTYVPSKDLKEMIIHLPINLKHLWSLCLHLYHYQYCYGHTCMYIRAVSKL